MWRKVFAKLRQDADFEEVFLDLSLLTNALMAWNTQHMQRAVERIEAISGEIFLPEDLRHIAPTNLEGINLRGTFEFPLTAYALRILPNSATVHAENIRRQSR